MVRIVVHAGFHKTGTTTVQTVAARNADLLAPYARVCLRDDFRDLTDAARAYSITRDAKASQRVYDAAAAFFRSLDPVDPRPVALLSEDLAGHLPGRHDIADYSAAPEVMAQVAAAAVMVLGAEIDMRFHFSTRVAEHWFPSAYWQILRAARRTEGLEEFARTFATAADFATVLAAITRAVAPFTVQSAPLETLTEADQGPITPLLDLLDVPPGVRARLDTGLPLNVRPDGLDEVFLALNRCGLPDGKVASLKKTMLRMARRLQVNSAAQGTSRKS